MSMHPALLAPGPAALMILVCAAVVAAVPSAGAEEADCAMCHADLAAKKVVHAAVPMGCPSCHTGIQGAPMVPHKITTKFPRGLSADQPDLCYGCHDKGLFTKKNVHAAIAMGCTTCHDPHSSDTPALLRKQPSEMCLDCHDAVVKRPHAISGFSGKGHPLGLPKQTNKDKEDKPRKERLPAEDPARKGKIFSCASCHDPHSSDSPRLFRYPVKSAMQLCQNCHKM